MSRPDEAWIELGRLLKQRRVQINPEYRNRLKFATETGLNERLVSDLEQGRRTGFRDTTLQAVEIAYQLKPGSIPNKTLHGAGLEPLEPVLRVTGVELEVPAPPNDHFGASAIDAGTGIRVAQDNERHLRVEVTVDPDITLEEALAPLGELTDRERATVAMLDGMKYEPALVAGAVVMLRGLASRRAEQARKQA